MGQLLRQMQLTETAAVLASEALEADRDIEQDVRDILADCSIPQKNKGAVIAAFCS